MERKQFWAKVGVFVLVVGNLGAYYAFWPESSGATGDQPGKPAEKKDGPLTLPPPDVKPADPAPLPDLPALPVPKNPLEAPKAAQQQPQQQPQGLPPMLDLPKPNAPLDALDKQTTELLNQIKSQGQPPVVPQPQPQPVSNPATISPVTPVVVQGLPPIEIPPPTPLQPPPLPSLQPGLAPQPNPMEVAPAALQRIENSPWMLQMEIVSGQTLLVAKLRKQVEFKILCDRVEMKAPDGAVQAVGKVSVSGSGMKGTCDRLTLPLAEDRMLLEGKAEVSIEDRAGASPSQKWELRGEQLNVRLSQLPALQGSPPPARLAPASLLEPSQQK